MRRRELSDEELNRIIRLRQIGTSWLKIQHETGIHRQTAKRAYERWEYSKSMEELKKARIDVAAQAFREHMDSLVILATSLVTNLSVPSSLTYMEKNTEQFFSWLWEQDLLQRYISPQTSVDVYRMGETQPLHIGDLRSYHREKELLFESLKVHTREEVRWEDILDNRWKKARDNCATIVPKLRKETSEVVKNFLNQERQTNFLKSVKERSREEDPAKRVVEVVLRGVWQAVHLDKLDKEGPWFRTALRGKGTPQEINVKYGDETVFTFFGIDDLTLAERVTHICNLAVNNLCKGDKHERTYSATDKRLMGYLG